MPSSVQVPDLTEALPLPVEPVELVEPEPVAVGAADDAVVLVAVEETEVVGSAEAVDEATLLVVAVALVAGALLTTEEELACVVAWALPVRLLGRMGVTGMTASEGVLELVPSEDEAAAVEVAKVVADGDGACVAVAKLPPGMLVDEEVAIAAEELSAAVDVAALPEALEAADPEPEPEPPEPPAVATGRAALP